MLRTYVVGAYGYGNVGDDACRDVIKKELLTVCPDAEIISHNPKLYRFNPEYYHILIIGGGGIIYEFVDPSGTHNPTYYLRYSRAMQLFDKKTIALGVGTQGHFTKKGKKVIKETFNNLDLITVRSEESKRDLVDCGVTKKIHVCADLAFMLEPKPPEEYYSIIRKKKNLLGIITKNKPLLGVCLTQSVENSIQPFHPEFNELVPKLISQLEKKFNLVFFSFDGRFKNFIYMNFRF